MDSSGRSSLGDMVRSALGDFQAGGGGRYIVQSGGFRAAAVGPNALYMSYFVGGASRVSAISLDLQTVLWTRTIELAASLMAVQGSDLVLHLTAAGTGNHILRLNTSDGSLANPNRFRFTTGTFPQGLDVSSTKVYAGGAGLVLVAVNSDQSQESNHSYTLDGGTLTNLELSGGTLFGCCIRNTPALSHPAIVKVAASDGTLISYHSLDLPRTHDPTSFYRITIRYGELFLSAGDENGRQVVAKLDPGTLGTIWAKRIIGHAAGFNIFETAQDVYVVALALSHQISTATITAHDLGTTYTVTIGGVPVSVLGQGGTTATTATALIAALNASTDPNFTAITWSGSGSSVTGTGDVRGVPFTAVSSVTGGAGTFGAFSTTTSANTVSGLQIIGLGKTAGDPVYTKKINNGAVFRNLQLPVLLAPFFLAGLATRGTPLPAATKSVMLELESTGAPTVSVEDVTMAGPSSQSATKIEGMFLTTLETASSILSSATLDDTDFSFS